MFDVFRFAWFTVRTFFGILLLVLVMRGALWTLVKLHSAAMAHANSPAATYRVPASRASITTPQSSNSRLHIDAHSGRSMLKTAYPCQVDCRAKD